MMLHFFEKIELDDNTIHILPPLLKAKEEGSF